MPASLVCFDEFTSVVDRNAAQIGSAAVAKAARNGFIPCRFVAVTCHYDVEAWLEPDWTLDMATGSVARRRLRRPPIRLAIVRAKRDAWRLFARHHYLSGSICAMAECFLGLWNDMPVSFCGLTGVYGKKGQKRVTRLVTLPDYQGVGIGGAMLRGVAALERDCGFVTRVTTSHPAMIAHLKGNPDWSVTAVAKQGRAIRRTFKKWVGHGLSGGNPLLVGPMCGELSIRSQGPAEKRGRLAVTIPARWHDLRGHLQQWTLWHNKVRFVAVPAGRRSGKTELAKRRLVLCLFMPKPWPDPRYFYAGPTYRQAKRVAWDDLIALTPSEWIERIRQTDLCIRTVWGSELWVLGLDQPARIEGVGWDGGVLDESCDLRQGVFGRSIRPALSDRGGWLWQIGVPKRAGPGAAEYREFCWRCARGEYPDGANFAWPSRDILPAAEIEHARETLDPRDFREQYEACWETAGGQIFHGFSREYNVRPCPYERNLPLVVGSDFNVDPLCWVIGHRYPNRLEWFDEIWLRNANTQAGLDTLYHRYQHHEADLSSTAMPVERGEPLRPRLPTMCRSPTTPDSSGCGGRSITRPPTRQSPIGSHPPTRCSSRRRACGGCSSTRPAGD